MRWWSLSMSTSSTPRPAAHFVTPKWATWWPTLLLALTRDDRLRLPVACTSPVSRVRAVQKTKLAAGPMRSSASFLLPTLAPCASLPLGTDGFVNTSGPAVVLRWPDRGGVGPASRRRTRPSHHGAHDLAQCRSGHCLVCNL